MTEQKLGLWELSLPITATSGNYFLIIEFGGASNNPCNKPYGSYNPQSLAGRASFMTVVPRIAGVAQLVERHVANV